MSKDKNRPSPSMSATQFKVGDIVKGNDGNKWIIRTNKNGINRWTRFNKSSSKSKKRSHSKSDRRRRIKSSRRTHIKSRRTKRKSKMKLHSRHGNNPTGNISPYTLVQYLKKNKITNIIFHKIAPELRKHGIKVYFVPQKTSALYIGDHWHHYLVDFHGGYDDNGNYIVFTIYFNNDREIDSKQQITVIHQLDREQRSKVFDIFDKYLQSNYHWNKKPNKTMFVDL